MIQQTIFPYKLEIAKEVLTGRSGLALMAEFNHGIGLRELVNTHLPEPGSNRGYSPSVFVDPMVLMLQGGGRVLEDIRELKEEAGLMKLIGQSVLPSSDALGDWLRRMGEGDGLKGLDTVRTTINHRTMKRDGLTEYTLDADATGIEAEKEEALFTYKGYKGYMPMLGFLYEARLCLYDEFREGNAAPASGQVVFYEECKKRMPKGKRIKRYRADSASYQAALINSLEEDFVKYGITASQDVSVKKAIKSIPETDWKEPYKGCGFQLAVTVHTMNETKQSFNLVVKREAREQDLFQKQEEEYFYHAVATNYDEEEKDAYSILKWHNERGTAENFNKELKIGFGMERMPCGTFSANAVFFRLGVISYNLFIGFKCLSCPEGWLRHTIATFRWKLIQSAGRIISHAGSTILKLSAGIEKLELFRDIRRKTYETSLNLSLA